MALYASKCLVAKRRQDLESASLEILCVEIRLHYNRFIVAVLYRPPNSLVKFWDDLQECFDKVKNSGIDKIVITGDLNADLNTNHGRKMIDFCTVNSLTVHVNEPTRITENTSSCLDQIITNIPNYVQNINVTTPVANSDHCTVSANLLFRRKKSPCFKRSVWDYKHANFDTFREKLFDVDWDACFDSDNIDVITDLWTDTFLKCAENSIPHKDVTSRPDDVPWYTNSLRALKRKIHRVHKNAKKRPALLPYFRQLRNTYIENLRLAEQAYYQRLEDSVHSTATQKKRVG